MELGVAPAGNGEPDMEVKEPDEEPIVNAEIDPDDEFVT
jgi:hypothetical protein